LINRSIGRVGSEKLWHTFQSHFNPVQDHLLEALYRHPGRTLKHIRNLEFLGPRFAPSGFNENDTEYPLPSPVAEDHFLILLRKLQRTEYSQKVQKIRSRSLLSLSAILKFLALVESIERLEVRVETADSTDPDLHQSLRNLPQLKNLKSFSIYLEGPNYDFDESDRYLHILELSPNIKELNLVTISRADCKRYKAEYYAIPPRLDLAVVQNLRSLGLHKMDCAVRLFALLDNIRLENLKDLSIVKCINIGLLLKGLIQLYQISKSSISQFVFQTSRNMDFNLSEDESADLQELIHIWADVKNLWLDLSPYEVNPVDCFMGHNSLETLYVNSCCYSAKDMSSIMGYCPTLKQLAINLPEPALGPVSRLAQDFKLSISEKTLASNMEIAELLVSLLHPYKYSLAFVNKTTVKIPISQHTNLQVFVSLNSPYFETTEDFDNQAWATFGPEDVPMIRASMTAFGQEVARYMTENGSRINLFAVSPNKTQKPWNEYHEDLKYRLGPRVPVCKDKDGHRWPQYFYDLSRTYTRSGIKVIASPYPDACKEITDLICNLEDITDPFAPW
jgi:hypothetical protein